MNSYYIGIVAISSIIGLIVSICLIIYQEIIPDTIGVRKMSITNTVKTNEKDKTILESVGMNKPELTESEAFKAVVEINKGNEYNAKVERGELKVNKVLKG